MGKITPFLWFDHEAEEAMHYYLSIFKNGRVISVNRVNGRVLGVTFELDGQQFMGLNAGPKFKFTEAISFFVNCETQAEVDELWEKLSAGGEKSRCGWVKDKYGLSWQIIPSVLSKMLRDQDPGKAKRTMQAMMQMDKIDMNRLQQAYDGK